MNNLNQAITEMCINKKYNFIFPYLIKLNKFSIFICSFQFIDGLKPQPHPLRKLYWLYYKALTGKISVITLPLFFQ